MLKETIGQRLRRIREELGLSQPKLAAKAGLHRQTIAKIEADERAPSGATARALATALGVTTDHLLGHPEEIGKGFAAVQLLLDSGEAGRMLPTPTSAELAVLRELHSLFDGPPQTPRSVAFILLSLRERPDWQRWCDKG